MRTALDGPHGHLAERHGSAVRYPPDVAPFGALGGEGAQTDWADLASLVGPRGVVALFDPPTPPAGWTTARSFDAVQMVRESAPTAPSAVDEDLVTLTDADLPAMLDLVARTEPGPFGPRTIELGRYLGVRDGDALAALTGERMRLPGWTEVSAVCTDPAHRGRGLARRLVEAVCAGIEARGQRPLLHVMAANTGARALYVSLGFEVRRPVHIAAVQAPG